MNTKDIIFSENHAGYIGILTIHNILIGHYEKLDPLAIIWATVKKRIIDRAGLSVTGAFTYDDNKREIVGRFYLSYTGEGTFEEQTAKYVESFPRQMQLFESTLLRFLEDDDGYVKYLSTMELTDYKTEDAKAAAGKATIQNYLKSINVRTDKDDKDKARRAKKVKKAEEKAKSAEKAKSTEKAKSAEKTGKTKTAAEVKEIKAVEI